MRASSFLAGMLFLATSFSCIQSEALPLYPAPVSAGGGVFAIGDLNGDGKDDIVVGQPAGFETVLGIGSGVFGPPIGGWCCGQTAMALGDLDRDGKLDLVKTDGISVSVYQGLGTGRFSPLYTYPVSGAASLALVDVNGDGKLDVVVTTGRGIAVLMGNGDGSLQPAVSYPANVNSNLVVTDLNNDGHPDIVVANSFTAYVLMNNGDGTYRAAAPYTGIYAANAVVTVGDVNGDGKPDIVTNGDLGYSVLLGNGDGTFQAPQSFSTADALDSVQLVDLNRDGHPDLVLSPTSDDRLVVMINNGSGVFINPHTYYVGKGTQGHTFGFHDFNGDGYPDLVVSNAVNADLTVQLNNGDGTFNTPISTDATRPTAVVAADVNGDGKIDLITGNGDDTIGVQFGNGDGTFQPKQSYPTGPVPLRIVVADLNGDGHPDIIEISLTELEIWLNDGHGAFTFANSYPVPAQVGDIVVSDLNGDHIPDIAITYMGSQDITVWYGTGGGAFTASKVIPHSLNTLGAALGIGIADVNGDGKQDLVVSYGGEVGVYLGNGDGSYQPAIVYQVGVNGASDLTLADMNGDGHIDILVTGGILYGNGDGTFQPWEEWVFGTTGISAADLFTYNALGTDSVRTKVVDINGDGLPDIVTMNSTDSVSIFLQNSNHLFQPPITYLAPDQLSDITVADVNGDNRPDIIVTASTRFTNAVQILEQQKETAPVFSNPNLTLKSPVNGSITGQVSATDAEGDSITYSILQSPKSGSAQIDSATGAFSYFSSTGFADSFTIVAYDGTEYSKAATITLTGKSGAPSTGGGGGGTLTIIEALLLILLRAYRFSLT